MKNLVFVFTLVLTFSISAQTGGWNPELKVSADEALSNMIKESPKLETFKSKAYAYVIFPKVTKNVIIITVIT